MVTRSCLGTILVSADDALGSITGRLDRKFHAAMERRFYEDPNRTNEIRLLNRTILVILSIGLGISTFSLGLAVQSQMVFAMFG